MTRMADVSHTNPHTGEPFVATFQRGIVAADGGERGAGSRASDAIATAGPVDEGLATDGAMANVGHVPPTEGTNRSFERGIEGRADRV